MSLCPMVMSWTVPSRLADRVLVFDGAMGTQIMARELAPRRTAGGAARVQRSGRAQPAGHREQIHVTYLEAGRTSSKRTRSRRPAQARRVRLGRPHRRDQPHRRGARPVRRCPRSLIPARFVAGAMDRPDAHFVVGPRALEDHVRRTRDALWRAGTASGRSRRRPAVARDEPRSLGNESRIADRARLRCRFAARSDSGAGDARRDRPHAARHDIRAVCATLDALRST